MIKIHRVHGSALHPVSHVQLSPWLVMFYSACIIHLSKEYGLSVNASNVEEYFTNGLSGDPFACPNVLCLKQPQHVFNRCAAAGEELSPPAHRRCGRCESAGDPEEYPGGGDWPAR